MWQRHHCLSVHKVILKGMRKKCYYKLVLDSKDIYYNDLHDNPDYPIIHRHTMALIKLVSDIPQLKCPISWDGYPESGVTKGMLADFCTRDIDEFPEVTNRSLNLHLYCKVQSIKMVFNRLKGVLLLIMNRTIRNKWNRWCYHVWSSTSEATVKNK